MNVHHKSQIELLASYWEAITSHGSAPPPSGVDQHLAQAASRLVFVLSPRGPDAEFVNALRLRLAQEGEKSAVVSIPRASRLISRGATASIAIVAALVMLSGGVLAAVNLLPSTPPPPASLEDLRIVAQGIDKNPGAAGREVGYGFVLENPNPDKTSEGGTYRVMAYEIHGQVISEASGSLPLFSPGEQIGVGGTLEISSGEAVDRLRVEVISGALIENEQIRPLLPEEVRFSDAASPAATGVLTNTYDVEIHDVFISALAYSSDGRIIGGGMGRIDSMAPGQTIPIQVRISSSEAPARVEVYASLSAVP